MKLEQVWYNIQMKKYIKKVWPNYEDEEYISLLDALEKGRVFDIYPIDGGFRMTEGCDDCFGIDLTKQDLIDLSDELRKLAE